MVGYGGRLGGGFHGLGPSGVGAGIIGVVADALSHGMVATKLAGWLAKKNGTTLDEEYNKADMLISLIYAIPIGGYAVARYTKLDYESDILDLIGCFGLGAGFYEAGSVAEVFGTLVKEL